MTFLRIVIPLHLFVSLKRGSKARDDDAWGRDLRRHRSGQREQLGVLTLGRPSDICIGTFDRLAAAWRTLLMHQTNRKPRSLLLHHTARGSALSAVQATLVC